MGRATGRGRMCPPLGRNLLGLRFCRYMSGEVSGGRQCMQVRVLIVLPWRSAAGSSCSVGVTSGVRHTAGSVWFRLGDGGPEGLPTYLGC